MKGYLVRVGMDLGQGTGGELGPIFQDGRFEFILIREDEVGTEDPLSYNQLPARNGGCLGDYLKPKNQSWMPHFDPEFNTPSYGEPFYKLNKNNEDEKNRKVSSMENLHSGDLLVFHAGLKAWENQMYPTRANYIIGYFTVDRLLNFTDKKIHKSEWNNLKNNPHIGYRESENSFIVVGKKNESNLLDRAISFTTMLPDRIGRPTVNITKRDSKLIGISGSVQRSMPRLLLSSGCEYLLDQFEEYID